MNSSRRSDRQRTSNVRLRDLGEVGTISLVECRNRSERKRRNRDEESEEERRARQQRDLIYHYNIRHEQDSTTYISGRPTEQQLVNFETDCLSAQLNFSNSTGFDTMYQALGSFEERRAAVLQACMKLLTPEEASERIVAYYDKMDPSQTIGACAVCGIQILGGPLSEKSLDQLNLLKLSENDMRTHLSLPYRAGFCRTEILNESGEIISVFYLHSQHVGREKVKTNMWLRYAQSVMTKSRKEKCQNLVLLMDSTLEIHSALVFHLCQQQQQNKK